MTQFDDDLARELADPDARADFARNAELIQRIDAATRERNQARQIAREMLATVLMATSGHRLTIIGAENPLPDWLTEETP